MRRRSETSPAELPLPFEYDTEPANETITARGGIPIAVQALRSLGVPASVKKNLWIKQRDRGLDDASYVESFVILNAAGGDCLDDFDQLRDDEGLQELIGHEFPSAAAARKFLYAFHQEEKIEQAKKQQLELGAASWIPQETPALEGLAQVNRDLIQELGQRCRDQKIATIDVDATVIESWKREAQATYQGVTGYQPLIALWAEMDTIVADQFRDGNVGAHTGLLPVIKQAYAALPSTVEERYFRGDSACYDQGLLKWLRNPKREDGPQGSIGFGISARMSDSLRERIRMLPEVLWKPYRQDAEVICECAEVLGWDPAEIKAGEELEPIRYLVIRIQRRQGTLFPDGSLFKHFAVVTNIWKWDAKQLLKWQREKAGSIEAAHDVLKNELAAGVMPCSRFGANAAWLRMAILTYNVLSALKRLALPAELLRARPKRMRFLIFNTAGRILHHARKIICRLKARTNLGEWQEIQRLLPIRA